MRGEGRDNIPWVADDVDDGVGYARAKSWGEAVVDLDHRGPMNLTSD